MEISKGSPFGADHENYINIKGAWDNILELEMLGMRFRDEEDEFVGAPSETIKTKIIVRLRLQVQRHKQNARWRQYKKSTSVTASLKRRI